jgi:hypothetical protein
VKVSVLGFPNPVNEKAARVVAGGVVLMSAATLLLSLADRRWLWLTVPLAYGFLARVLTGPTLSPLGQVATRVVAPRLGAARLVPGPPKRFAQAIGTAFTVTAVVLVALHADRGAQALLGIMVVFATLESVFALCVGCRVFALLMRLGVVPESVCEACSDISSRWAPA